MYISIYFTMSICNIILIFTEEEVCMKKVDFRLFVGLGWIRLESINRKLIDNSPSLPPPTTTIVQT